jgi:hypothetical protein
VVLCAITLWPTAPKVGLHQGHPPCGCPRQTALAAAAGRAHSNALPPAHPAKTAARTAAVRPAPPGLPGDRQRCRGATHHRPSPGHRENAGALGSRQCAPTPATAQPAPLRAAIRTPGPSWLPGLHRSKPSAQEVTDSHQTDTLQRWHDPAAARHPPQPAAALGISRGSSPPRPVPTCVAGQRQRHQRHSLHIATKTRYNKKNVPLPQAAQKRPRGGRCSCKQLAQGLAGPLSQPASGL